MKWAGNKSIQNPFIHIYINVSLFKDREERGRGREMKRERDEGILMSLRINFNGSVNTLTHFVPLVLSFVRI